MVLCGRLVCCIRVLLILDLGWFVDFCAEYFMLHGIVLFAVFDLGLFFLRFVVYGLIYLC